MHNGVKAVSTAVLTAAVLASAACGSSGSIGASTGGSSRPGGVLGKTSSAPTGAKSGAPSSVSTGSSSGAPTGGSRGSLTIDQIKPVLLTDKDDAGYTYDASADNTTTTSTPHTVTAGGAACQTFVDAQDGLTTKYGTTAEVDRELKKAAAGHVIESSIMAFPSSDKAAAVISDATAGLRGCKNLSAKQAGKAATIAIASIPQSVTDGRVGYVENVTIADKTVMVSTDVVHVGTAVSVVALIGPVTSDTNSLHQMGATLAHLSDLQVGRLKSAQGIS